MENTSFYDSKGSGNISTHNRKTDPHHVDLDETLWRRDKEQLPSAEALLREFGDDVNVFEIEVEEGVQQLCWGVGEVGMQL